MPTDITEWDDESFDVHLFSYVNGIGLVDQVQVMPDDLLAKDIDDLRALFTYIIAEGTFDAPDHDPVHSRKKYIQSLVDEYFHLDGIATSAT